jgi:hypothetical protein
MDCNKRPEGLCMCRKEVRKTESFIDAPEQEGKEPVCLPLSIPFLVVMHQRPWPSHHLDRAYLPRPHLDGSGSSPESEIGFRPYARTQWKMTQPFITCMDFHATGEKSATTTCWCVLPPLSHTHNLFIRSLASDFNPAQHKVIARNLRKSASHGQKWDSTWVWGHWHLLLEIT